MSSFELQTFKNGQWIIDSYYDDRDLALSEADRLDASGRHSGVRVLKEEYHEPTNTSNYQVIFSRIKKIESNKGDWRISAKRAARQSSKSRSASNAPRPARQAQPQPKKKNGSLSSAVLIAVLVLLAGVGAMFVLENDKEVMGAIDSLLNTKSR